MFQVYIWKTFEKAQYSKRNISLASGRQSLYVGASSLLVVIKRNTKWGGNWKSLFFSVLSISHQRKRAERHWHQQLRTWRSVVGAHYHAGWATRIALHSGALGAKKWPWSAGLQGFKVTCKPGLTHFQRLRLGRGVSCNVRGTFESVAESVQWF